ncbi:MAG TPA: DUF4389 domain-containing protein [Caldilineaceae bacterium]|nr:DUF4389 domain-containing protein [Caldilineaceae bacterium]
MTNQTEYAARLEIDYPEERDRLTVFFRLLWIIPIAIILGLIAGAGETVTYRFYMNEAGEVVRRTRDSASGLAGGLAAATALMIVFRQRYPRWWFDFARELTRFSYRVGSYLLLLTDQYPSTVEEQSVHLEIDYPDAENDLNRGLPLIKWLLAIPHYMVLLCLGIVVFFVTIFAWFTILLTGQYPRNLFDFVVGVGRWGLRVSAYAFLLVTDSYPPFRLH